MLAKSPRQLIVVFGAAVRADGRPSPSLRRRIDYAAGAAARYPEADLFCSGAAGAEGPSEASVMAAILAEHIDPARLHLDEVSIDTLTSVRAAAAFFRKGGYDHCLTCTDRYHQARIRMLFAFYGIYARPIMFYRDEERTKAWWRMRAREGAALPYDFVAGLGARARDLLRRR
ncbi:YdcF family protein [Sphingomonas sp. PB4P5]|uniref:YdcF family protein n=1 Tax=Parasphingomonas puruogangriensis TaxID=3096155 RepID=UPI002FCAD3B2